MALGRVLGAFAASFAFAGLVAGHGGGGAHQKPIQVDPEANWATRHMAEEHHIGNFDPASFFTLHDFDNNGVWDHQEILKLYGAEDPDPAHEAMPQYKKDEIVQEIDKMMDTNNNGIIEREEFLSFVNDKKGTLPDFGTGPGHHWDIEMEYEIHHWEKYHDENTKEEDLIHPEDIAHFKLHDDLEDEAERVAQLDRQSIVEANIPAKFRREGL